MSTSSATNVEADVRPPGGLRALLHLPISWKELFVRTFKEVLKDDAEGMAAQLSYYFFLSLFPMLLALVALASLFPLHHFTDDLIRLMRPVMPAQAIQVIADQMLALANGKNTGVLTFGVAAALWSGSGAMGAVVNAMNRAYDIDEGRAWWKVRLLSLGLTIGLAFFILTSLTLVLAGPQIADLLSRTFGFASAWAWAWKIAQWPLVVAMVFTGITLIYYFAPDAKQHLVWTTPGATLATLLWLAGSLAFRAYVVHYGDYEGTYGAIGGMIVLLLWFYQTSLVIVIGAELNAEIEHASPWGKDPGEKVAGAGTPPPNAPAVEVEQEAVASGKVPAVKKAS